MNTNDKPDPEQAVRGWATADGVVSGNFARCASD
jgi:hypothetical protein